MHAIAETRQAIGRAPPRVLVPVESEQLTIGRAGFENRLGVAAAAERTVDVTSARARAEQLDRFAQHHRDVDHAHGRLACHLNARHGSYKFSRLSRSGLALNAASASSRACSQA